MQQVINKMKKAPVIDEKTGDYNLRYNMQNITEDFFLPVRGGDSGTSIESMPGLTYEATEDIEYLKNKLLSALRIPKAFLGYDERKSWICRASLTAPPKLDIFNTSSVSAFLPISAIKASAVKFQLPISPYIST